MSLARLAIFLTFQDLLRIINLVEVCLLGHYVALSGFGSSSRAALLRSGLDGSRLFGLFVGFVFIGSTILLIIVVVVLTCRCGRVATLLIIEFGLFL